MKTKYKYIYFERSIPGIWVCRDKSSQDVLGCVEYNKPWKQHAIEFEEIAIFNNQRLNDIADFLTQLNKSGGRNDF